MNVGDANIYSLMKSISDYFIYFYKWKQKEVLYSTIQLDNRNFQ